jgi:shikimate 5-dehydrogenase
MAARLAGGSRLAVWNRTHARAEALARAPDESQAGVEIRG